MCCHKMGVYVQVLLVGGRQTMHILNHVFILFYCGIQNEHRTKKTTQASYIKC
jgi:hypothetical protein